MRTKYESKKDLQLEQKTLGYVSDCWNVAYFKLPISYKLDYSMYRNGVLVGWAEVKCRNHNFGTFPTYIISLGKVMEARKLSEFSNVKSTKSLRTKKSPIPPITFLIFTSNLW